MKVNKQLPHHRAAFGDELQGQSLLLLWYSGIHTGSGAVRDTQALHRFTLLQAWQQAQSYLDLLSAHLVRNPSPSSLAKTEYKGFLAYLLSSLTQNTLVEALFNNNEKKFFCFPLFFLSLCPLCSQGKLSITPLAPICPLLRTVLQYSSCSLCGPQKHYLGGKSRI